MQHHDAMPAPTPHARSLWGQRFNTGLVVTAAVVALVWAVSLLRHGFSLWVPPMTVVLWACLVSVALLIEWAVLARSGRGVPHLPGPLAPLSGDRRVVGAMLVFLAAVTLLREGALAPSFVLAMNAYSTQSSHNTQESTSGRSQAMGPGTEARMAGSYVSCQVICQPSGAVCDQLQADLLCDNHRGPNTGGRSVVYAQVNVTHSGDPMCYVPLYKSASSRMDATADLNTARGGASAHQHLTITSTLEHTMTGMGSCYAFKEQVGRQHAQRVGASLNAIIRAN